MHEITQHRTPRSATGSIVVLAVSAAMATGQGVAWPDRVEPIYTVPQPTASYSPSFEAPLTFTHRSTSSDFAREIAGLYAAFSEGQEPLGAEFEAIWDANVGEQYEA